MKKSILLLLSLALFTGLFAGCSSQKILDREQAVKNIEALTFENDGETQPLFNGMLDLDSDMATVYNIDTSLLADYTFRMPMFIVKANLYIIAKPAEGKEAEAKEMLDGFMQSYEDQWASYLPDQYQMVKNRTVTEVGGYLIYIVSADNAAVMNAIDTAAG